MFLAPLTQIAGLLQVPQFSQGESFPINKPPSGSKCKHSELLPQQNPRALAAAGI